MANESWHLSKAIPVTLILSIILQTIVLVVFLTNLAGNVANNSEDIILIRADSDVLERTVQDQEVTLGRIDENIKRLLEYAN